MVNTSPCCKHHKRIHHLDRKRILGIRDWLEIAWLQELSAVLLESWYRNFCDSSEANADGFKNFLKFFGSVCCSECIFAEDNGTQDSFKLVGLSEPLYNLADKLTEQSVWVLALRALVKLLVSNQEAGKLGGQVVLEAHLTVWAEYCQSKDLD
jgi:hypothetical protein